MTEATAQVIDEDELASAARRAAGALGALRFVPGDRLAVVAGNGPAAVIARDAATILDLVYVPLSPTLTAPELAALCARAGTQVLVTDDLARPLPRELELWSVADLVRVGLSVRAPKRKPTDKIGDTLLFTSGTTGVPKACHRGEAAETARAAELIATYGLGAHDTHLVVCPLSHSAPSIFLRAARAVGAKTVLAPRFAAEQFGALVAGSGATVVFLVPTQVERLLALPDGARAALPGQLAGLRRAIVAGAPFSPRARRAFRELLPDGALWEFYGASETGTITVRPPSDAADAASDAAGDDDVPGLVGAPPPGVTIELRDAAGQPIPPGSDASGEVFVRSPTLMRGYVSEPVLAPDAWISVGDLARRDARGRLVLVDRKHDTLISGGVNVYPAEVERALAEHPAVAAAVVYGVASAAWGQEVRALVAARAGAALDADALHAFLRERLAGPKRPKRIDVVSLAELPIGGSGKPLRRLAAEVAARLVAAKS